MRQCVMLGKCTKIVTGTEFEEQIWYECFTCGMTENVGVCESCKSKI